MLIGDFLYCTESLIFHTCIGRIHSKLSLSLSCAYSPSLLVKIPYVTASRLHLAKWLPPRIPTLYAMFLFQNLPIASRMPCLEVGTHLSAGSGALPLEGSYPRHHNYASGVLRWRRDVLLSRPPTTSGNVLQHQRARPL